MSTNPPDLDVCYECGGHDLFRVSGPGRSRTSRGFTYEVPADLAILTCQTCGTEWPTGEDLDKLSAAREAQQALRPRALAGE